MHLKLASAIILSLGILLPMEALPVPGTTPIHILRYENVQSEDNYKFDYHNSDGQKREETGLLINGGQELVVYGSYSYTGPDNKVYRVDYTADRNGFNPKVTIGAENVQEDSQTIRPPVPPHSPPPPPPAISPAAYDPNSEINPHALKSLLGG